MAVTTSRSDLESARSTQTTGAQLPRRMRTLYVTAIFTLLVLAVQFVLGMANNLFGAFPATSDVLAALESTGDPLLIAHMVVAFLLLLLGIVVAILALRRPVPRSMAALAIGGLIAIFWAYESGIEFILSRFSNDAMSFSMALGFLVALAIYGALGLTSALRGGSSLAAGLAQGARADGDPQESRPSRS